MRKNPMYSEDASYHEGELGLGHVDPCHAAAKFLGAQLSFSHLLQS